MQYVATLSPVRTAAHRPVTSPASRVHDRPRVIAHLVLGVLVASALLVSVASIAHDPEAPIPASWGTVSVSQNATLWSIAEAHPVVGRSTADTVELICAENGLPDGTIHAGQVLRVPGPAPTVALAQR